MTSQAIAKNISNTLSKEVEKQVTPVDAQNNQVDNDFTLVERKKNIKKINLEDFPTPGSVILTKKQEKKIIESNKMSCDKKIELDQTITDPRTIAFNHMADRKKVATALYCTKACHNIQRDKETGKFGVCERAYCTFAHSMAELKPPLCSFDDTCRFRNGKIIDWNTRSIAPNSKCKFLHSNETIKQYYARTRMALPDLPPTSKETRKIPTGNETIVALTSARQYSRGQHRNQRMRSLESDLKRVQEQPKEQPKEQPDDQPKEQPKKQPKEQKASRRLYDSDMSSDSESSDSESSESENEEERCRRLRKERKSSKSKSKSKSKRSSPKNTTQVIRVPTKELAEIALKMAFDRGQFDIQVLIE